MMDFNTIAPFINEARRAEADALIKSISAYTKTPLIIQVLTFLGAWVGMLFFVGFLALVFFARFEEGSAITMGLLFIALAFFLQYNDKGNIFLKQLMIAAMFLGKVSLIAGALLLMRGELSVNAVFLILLFVLGLIYPFFRNTADRLISAFAIGAYVYVCAVFGSYTFGEGLFLWYYITPHIFLALTFAFSLYVFYCRRAALYPLAFGLVAAGAFASYGAQPQPYMQVFFNAPKVIMIISFAALGIVHLKQTSALNKRNIIALALCSTLLFIFNLASVIGITYILLGRNFKDIRVQLMGYIVFAAGLSYLYYSLHTTLLIKSGMLLLSGVAVLLAALLARRYSDEK